MPSIRTGSTSEVPLQKEMNRPRQDSEGYYSSTTLYPGALDVLLKNGDRLNSTVQPLIEKDEYNSGFPPLIVDVDPYSVSENQQSLHIPQKAPPSSYFTPVGEVVEYKRKQLSKKSPTCCFGLLLAVVNIVLLVVGTGGVVFLYFKYSDLQCEMNEMMKKSEDASEVCMPCGDLKVGIFEEDNAQLQFLIRKEVSGVEVCCAKTPDQTRIMFDLVSMELFIKRSN